jgi:hypothetical protein
MRVRVRTKAGRNPVKVTSPSALVRKTSIALVVKSFLASDSV